MSSQNLKLEIPKLFRENLSMRSGKSCSYQKAKFCCMGKMHALKRRITGSSTNKIKGGFICELFNGAISAFLPQSHLDTKPIRGAAVDRLMRTPIKVKIVRLEKQGETSCSEELC